MYIALLLSSLLTFVELNCENLFDCRHDSLKQDTEFTPDGGRRWTPRRYHRKLNAIGQAILSCSEELPDLVALCEVENDSVLHHLCRMSLLRGAGYDYFITESPDVRGVDVALLYQPAVFQPLCYEMIGVLPMPGQRPTRDILYVKGLLRQDDTLHVFVVHAPSRYGGAKATVPYRRHVAEILAEAIRQVRQREPAASILIAGDFNDTADSPAINMLTEEENLTCITRQAKGIHGSPAGYRYHGRWEQIDHILLSEPLRQRLHSVYVNDAPFLMEEEPLYGGKRPRRTFYGFSYQYEGVSDHLPVVAQFKW